VKEIRNDMRTGFQMNRLLQGDVGSGKTLVALLCMLIAIDNGFQASIIAPTEILAQQHYNSIKNFLKDMPLNVCLLTGSSKQKERKPLLNALAEGQVNILIGTHAILEDNVVFKNLGLAVIDEQHRFGVEQRAKMWSKNTTPPHVLVMTATPIPRTLAMSVYGDLECSVIDELPKGRKPIQTTHLFDRDILTLFNFMRKQIDLGRQIYVVYPLIKESEKMDLKDLMDGYESIVREFPLPKYQISIVHGQMKAEDKDYEMQRFKEGITNIMVATTVIEVGVDVPNATVMVIENAERFGLAQLHQLRGRVGRGQEQSYCILRTKDELSQEGLFRINTMCATNNGFEIAQADLQLRGPGNIAGTQQSGVMELKIADIVQDELMMSQAKDVAAQIISHDPLLKAEENKPLRNYLARKHKTADFSQIS
jgi:ATP-dependent DNA helicase RecG